MIGGGTVGCEVAHKLIDEDKAEVTVVEMLPELCMGHEFAHRMLLNDFLKEKATVCTSTTVTAIKDGEVCVKDSEGREAAIPADCVIYATGVKAVSQDLYETLLAEGFETYRAGDWKIPNNFLSTTRSAFELAYSI